MLKGRIRNKVKKEGIGTIGKIKIGKKNEKGFPMSLDYFLPDATGEYQKMFWETFGDKPKTLKIVFISNDPSHACNEQFELRDKAGKMFCKSDGETYGIATEKSWIYKTTEELEKEYGTMSDFSKAMIKASGSKGWETRLTMRFMIPQLKGLLGEWQLSTKGKKTSIDQITQVYDKVLESAGSVIMLPFDLSVEKVKSDRSGSKNSYPILKLIPNNSFESLQTVRNSIEQGTEVWKHGVLTDEKILTLGQG